MGEEGSMREFLTLVWGDTPGVGAVPQRDPTKPKKEQWRELTVTWPHAGPIPANPDRVDCYFSPLLYKTRHAKGDGLPTHWLWSDLDTVDPQHVAPRPTVAWQSSPGRYQALWRLGARIPAAEAAGLSRRLAYALGADRGGWDEAQVLRIPGTRNHKYPGAPRVELLWQDGPAYDRAQLEVELPAVPVAPAAGPETRPAEPSTAILTRWMSKLSIRARSLLATSAAEAAAEQGHGEGRSGRLHELACLLAEAGMSVTEIAAVTQASAWNKFRGRADEWHRLIEGARKAAVTQAPVEDTGTTTPFLWLRDILVADLGEADWLIEHIWLANSWGFIGGEAKTGKSLLTMEAAVSVAGGVPFLGVEKFRPATRGPVLVVQEENDAFYLQDIMLKVLTARGLLPAPALLVEGARHWVAALPDLPIRFLNQSGFVLSDREQRDRIEAEIREVQPVLVVFDPLYSMLGSADENKEHEIRPFLNWLRNVAQRHTTSVMVCHHWRKKQGRNDTARAGQRLGGTRAFHNWTVSALYVDRPSDDEFVVKLTREFRRAPSGAPLQLAFALGEIGTQTYRVLVGPARDAEPLPRRPRAGSRSASPISAPTP